ncbi:hypothetical protein L1987_11777 [Smallanthus sonchifolius]|uniref:Uncharacterized protein n=1 Tax=Smallanthus sonchifolius TaxID=185202 RepID=A0ACB9JE08_9ASTR|nr:hypothetical protein L1987_11777 [Smallanthus sonchifolius]
MLPYPDFTVLVTREYPLLDLNPENNDNFFQTRMFLESDPVYSRSPDEASEYTCPSSRVKDPISPVPSPSGEFNGENFHGDFENGENGEVWRKFPRFCLSLLSASESYLFNNNPINPYILFG